MSATTAPGAPLRFRNPPGWPQPTPEWVAEHQGWQPPPRWTPVAGVPRAPRNWVFWEHNALTWSLQTQRFTAAAKAAVIVGWVLTAAGLAVAGGTWWLAGPTIVLGVGGAIAAIGLAVAIRAHVNLGRANRRAYLAMTIATRRRARAPLTHGEGWLHNPS